jgi:exodeoxyribonuclease-1
VSYVIYDVETTGLTRCFDQIVQFAAVRTDDALKVTDQYHIRCRLMPHVIPSPEALNVTGLRIEQLVDPSLPSHFTMVTEIRRVLESWCPTLFLGYNSLSFDEEFLRLAFYQCLHGPYLTNAPGNARADVLNLCRITAALRPDVIKPATNKEGRPVFKLKALAEANDIVVPLSHDAIADVATTLALCQHVRMRAPEIWSQFLRFSKKASVEAFITEEDAFLVSETFGNHHRARAVTRIGKHSEQATKHYCLDLSADLEAIRTMPDIELILLCQGDARPIVTIRTNAAPTLWALYDATPDQIAPLDETEIVERAQLIREDQPLMERLCKVAQAAEPSYPPSPHVEEQLYGHAFPSPQDKTLMQDFHEAHWEKRVELAGRFTDMRFRLLAERLIYLERPGLLEENLRLAADEELRNRVMAPISSKARWRSIPAAQRDLEAFIEKDLEGDQLANMVGYGEHLRRRASEYS